MCMRDVDAKLIYFPRMLLAFVSFGVFFIISYSFSNFMKTINVSKKI